MDTVDESLGLGFGSGLGGFLLRNAQITQAGPGHGRIAAALGDKLSHAPVGKQHEFLYEPVGFLAYLLIYAYRTALFIYFDLHFRTLETDGSGCEAFLAELGRKLVQDEDSFLQLVRYKAAGGHALAHCGLRMHGGFFAGFGSLRGSLQDWIAHHSVLSVGTSSQLHLHGLVSRIYYLLGSLVCKTVVGIYHRAAEPLRHHLGERGYLKDGRETQFRFIRTQGTELVGKLLRKHRDSPVHKIHRSAPLLSLLVHHGTWLHIMGHICNMYPDLIIAVVQFPERKGVVKVLGICRVDGEGQHIAEIPSLFPVGSRYLVRNLVRGILHLRLEPVRQGKFRKDCMHFGIIFPGFPEHIHQMPDRVGVLLVPSVHDCSYLHPRAGLKFLPLSVHGFIDTGDRKKPVAFLLQKSGHCSGSSLSSRIGGSLRLPALFLA